MAYRLRSAVGESSAGALTTMSSMDHESRFTYPLQMRLIQRLEEQ
jgi:hypothetical protein